LFLTAGAVLWTALHTDNTAPAAETLFIYISSRPIVSATYFNRKPLTLLLTAWQADAGVHKWTVGWIRAIEVT